MWLHLALMIGKSNYMTYAHIKLYKFIKDTKALLRPLTFILILAISWAHQKMVKPEYGTLKKIDYSILLKVHPMSLSLVGKAIILWLLEFRKLLICGKLDSMTASKRKYYPFKDPKWNFREWDKKYPTKSNKIKK